MNGIVPLNKDSGVLSRKAGNAVSFLYGEKKHGHAGTLDPLASGVLPVLLGRATKLIPFLDDEKTYEAKLRFGSLTDTGDITGNEQKTSDFRPKKSDFEAILPRFLGEIAQIPPLFSALKKDGRPLYDYARKGQQVEIAPRKAVITDLKLNDFDGEGATITVSCKTGTYIRTLIEDLAQACGALATMTQLCRTKASGISIEECRTVEQMQAGERPMIDVQNLFSHRPACRVDAPGRHYLLNGGTLTPNRFDTPVAGLCRAYDGDDRFLGLCLEEQGEVKLVWMDKIYE